MKEERILITGGSGFIGTNLVELFIEKKYNFFLLVRKYATQTTKCGK